MKITEIEFGTGKTYVSNKGILYKAHELGLYEFDKCGNYTRAISATNYLVDILKMNFEEQVDWSKVEVDTPILVPSYGKEWMKRHFAKFENGKVYYHAGGATSWTNGYYGIVEAEEAKLSGIK